MTASATPSAAVQGDELLLYREGRVATLEINRPSRRNALSTDLLAAIAEELDRLDRDPEVRCIVLRGSDEVFASGADLNSLSESSGIELYLGSRFRSWEATRQVRKPLVAAVSGLCLGGGFELAIGCDLIVASESSRFGLPETGIGLVPAAGGTQRLPRLIGRARALDVILAGRILTAAEAEEFGLLSRLVPPDCWREQAASLAEAVCRRGPLALRLAKEAVNASYELSLEAGFDLERRTFAIALDSAEGREGIAAFLEKRDPSWLEQ